ncbi:DMT family transporter [Candidatus Stoquefichus massiliensis]|uniref:DMT family transporter n=1 Tax=Candidatus Stoquefichus massiliensis TaxID=1470350 RepID=UPI0004874056|nr:DMT family transporter [Candidatus Stoquefichus massiliensis]
MSQKMKGGLLLLTAAMIWGSSFIVMKSAVDFLTPAVLLLVRFTLAAIFLSILFLKKIKTFPKQKIIGGLLTGCCLFGAYYVQTWGLNFTTPGKNAFLTAVYCAIVPFLVWLFYHKRPDVYNFIAAFICVLGIGCVSIDGNLTVNIGDFLTLCGGFLYAIHILMIKKFSEGVDGGAFTAYQFVGGAIVAGIFAFIGEDITLVTQIDSSIFLQIFYLAFFATAVTMVCQTIGQKYTSECNASLILSLESVFGVAFSVLFYGEVLTLKVVLGFVLIFIAIIISETKLSFLKRGVILDEENN